MNREAQLLLIEWPHLSTDPHSSGFLQQKVSPPTPECPQGSEVGDNVWYFPRCAAGGPSAHLRRIDWRSPAGAGLLVDPENAPLLEFAKRFAIALMSRPGRQLLRLATIKRAVGLCLHLCDFAISATPPGAKPCLAKLSRSDMKRFVKREAKTWRKNSPSFGILSDTFRRIHKYGKDGLLGDRFERIDLKDLLDLCKTDFGPLEPRERPPDYNDHSTPPYPDEFCVKMMEVSDFYDDVFVDCILEHVTELARMRREDADTLGMHNRHPKCARVRYAEFARKYDKWPVKKLPFRHAYHFPPRTTRQLLPLISALQSGNQQKTALLTGTRDGELLSMEKDCLAKRDVQSKATNFLRSVRFKNAVEFGGEDVEWPIPETVVQAIEVQLRLAKALDSPSVWSCIKFDKFGKRLTGSTVTNLQRFARDHFLDAKVGSFNSVSIQRYRPTIANLIIRGAGGHPRLVKRVLGHKEIDTTILYLEMSPFIQQELAAARLSRMRAIQPNKAPASDNPLLIALAEDFQPAEMGVMIADWQGTGAEVRLLAPGIVISSVPSDGMTDGAFASDPTTRLFEQKFVRKAAFAFAVDLLTRTKVRGDTPFFAWLSSEARRIARSWEGPGLYDPVTLRHRDMFAMIVKKDSSYAR